MRAALALAVLGAALSGILLARSWELAAGAAPGGGPCAILGGGCDDALAGSNLLGIPLAGWGVVHYGTLAAALAAALLLGAPHAGDLGRAALALAVLGSCAGLLLLGRMAFGASPFCPLCAAVHGTGFALLGVLALRPARPDPGAVTPVRTAVLLVPALVALAVLQWTGLVGARREAARPQPLDAESLLIAFRMGAVREIPSGPEVPARGPVDAAARFVVFSDFLCPACRAFASRIREVERRFPGAVRVEFRHFPLDGACSPVPGADLHPGACAAARLAEAARRRGRFEEIHDALFRAQGTAGPAPGGLESDATLPAVAARVAADLALGASLGLREAPGVFLNGRKVPDLRLSTLVYLVANEVLAARNPEPVKALAGAR